MTALTIYGQVPSKKNSKQLFMQGGKPRMLSSKIYRQWEHDAVFLIRSIMHGQPAVETYPVNIYCTFYVKDKRGRDLDNMLSSVLDALVLAGVIREDNWEHVQMATAKFGGLDKYMPRVEIKILPTIRPVIV